MGDSLLYRITGFTLAFVITILGHLDAAAAEHKAYTIMDIVD